VPGTEADRRGSRSVRMRGRLYGLLLVFALSLATAPAALAQWPQDGQNPFNTRHFNSGPSASKAPVLALQYNETLDGDVTGTPILAPNGLVYVGTTGGTVYSLYQKLQKNRTSQVYRARAVGGPIRGSLMYQAPSTGAPEGVLYVPVARSGAPSIVALDAINLTQRWETVVDTQRDAVIFGGINYSAEQNMLYVGTCACLAAEELRNSSHIGLAVAVDATTGAVVWRTATVNSSGRGGGIAGTPMVFDPYDSVYVATDHQFRGTPPAHPYSDALLKLDTATGNVTGTHQIRNDDIAEHNSPDPTKRQGFTAGPLAFTSKTGGRILVGAGAGTGTFYAVNAQTMALEFTSPVGVPSSQGGVVGMAAQDGKAIYGSSALPGIFWAVDRAGAPVWVSPAVEALRYGPVSSSRGVLWATDSAGFLDAQDTVTGRILGRHPLGRPSTGGVSVGSGYVYAAIGTGRGTGGGLAAFK